MERRSFFDTLASATVSLLGFISLKPNLPLNIKTAEEIGSKSVSYRFVTGEEMERFHGGGPGWQSYTCYLRTEDGRWVAVTTKRPMVVSAVPLEGRKLSDSQW